MDEVDAYSIDVKDERRRGSISFSFVSSLYIDRKDHLTTDSSHFSVCLLFLIHNVSPLSLSITPRPVLFDDSFLPMHHCRFWAVAIWPAWHRLHCLQHQFKLRAIHSSFLLMFFSLFATHFAASSSKKTYNQTSIRGDATQFKKKCLPFHFFFSRDVAIYGW